jgi:putative NADPH-quinone reductase
MATIAIIDGNPIKGERTYAHALAIAYKRGAEAGGHTAEIITLAALDFDPILHIGYTVEQAHEPELASAYAKIKAADHLVIIFPLWLGDMPALLKGFLERLLQPDLIEPAKKGEFVKLLDGKSARVIVTMGMPEVFYRFYFRAPALKVLRYHILEFMGVKPVHFTIHGRIANVTDETRRQWLSEAEDLGRDAA